MLRLCTNERKVIDYWNNIDKELELELDVLDDVAGDASEVKSFNPWITYGEPLHRCVSRVSLCDLMMIQPLGMRL